MRPATPQVNHDGEDARATPRSLGSGRRTGVLAIELAGIGLPWAHRAHGDRCGGSTGWIPWPASLVGGAVGVFLFPVYLSHADRQVLRSCLSRCAESTGSGPKLYHRRARQGPFCYDQGLIFRPLSLFRDICPAAFVAQPPPFGPERVVSPPALPARELHPRRRIRPPAGSAHPDPGRRHGHDDPALQAGRGRFPRRALRRPWQGPQGRQRAAVAGAAGRDLRDPPPVPGGRRRRHRDQHLRRHLDRAGRLRPAGTGLRTEPGVRATGAPGL